MKDLIPIRILVDIPKDTDYINIDAYTIEGEALQYVLGINLLYKVKRRIINYDLMVMVPKIADYFYIKFYSILTSRGRIYSELLGMQEVFTKEWMGYY